MHQLTIFDEEETTGFTEDAPIEVQNAWRKAKRDMKQNFTKLQEMPYDLKILRQKGIAEEFLVEMQKRGKNVHVSVGGLDSITLYIWLISIGIDCPAISVSKLEDKGNQAVHKALGVEIIKSYKSKAQVLNECGFPVISKRIAGKINLLQNPSENNKTVRHAIITGECGELGHFAKNSRMKLPQKWLELFGGYENENEHVNYKKPNFKVSNDCCYWLKEKPCDDWAKEHNSYPYLGMMASEGGQREEALVEHGCNYYGVSTMRSAPFAPFMRNDILRLALEMNDWYHDHLDVFEAKYYAQPYSRDKDGNVIPYVPIDSIIPTAYGEIRQNESGDYYTTRAQRTGCSMCGFGIHLEERPHRFDRLREDNPKEWEMYMYRCATDPDTGEKFGWGRVLDYIGVEWENPPDVQMSLDMFFDDDGNLKPLSAKEKEKTEMELRVNEVQLPAQITFNYEELKAELTERVHIYETMVYTDDQIKAAKDDRANLNKLKKALNDERIRREKEYMVPFNTFKAQITELCGIIDKAAAAVDTQVKSFEDNQKREKQAKIMEIKAKIEEDNASDLQGIVLPFDDKWLNASTSIKSIEEALKGYVTKITTDLATLQNLPEFGFEAVEVYKSTLDINRAIGEAQRMSAIAKAKAEREAEMARRAEEEAARKQAEAEAAAQAKAESDEVPAEEEPAEEKPQPARAWIKFQALMTVDDALALKAFLNSRNIEYKAI